MRTPVGPLRTRLIHIRPSYWTLFRSFEIILERGVAHWIGLQIQCSIPGVGRLIRQKSFFAENQKRQRAANSVCSVNSNTAQ